MTDTSWSEPVSFPNALDESAKLTDAALERLLAVPPGLEARVYDAMRYSALAPGKRLRPFLVFASARLFGVARRCALQVAAAVEMVHTYSLVHDDLPAMDNSDLRRGRAIDSRRQLEVHRAHCRGADRQHLARRAAYLERTEGAGPHA